MIVYQVILSPTRAAIATSVSGLVSFLRPWPAGRFPVVEVTQGGTSIESERHWGEIVRHGDGSIEVVPSAGSSN